MWWGGPWLLLSFLTYLADQGTDALTALLLLQGGHLLAGALTALLVLVPGLVACTAELVSYWRGRGGSVPRAGALLVLCPLWALLTHLHALYSPEWRARAHSLKTVEGLLAAGPQLVLQVALLLRGSLTSPIASLVQQTAPLTGIQTNFEESNLTLFGREYDSEDRFHLGVIQMSSIVVSLVSVLTSVLHFNEVESGGGISPGRLLLGLPFFLFTILYRTISLGLILCFLGWWSAVLLFLLFFLTVLSSLCAGDTFPRSCLYGLCSLLAPVGHARHPLTRLGYSKLSTSPPQEEGSSRASYFVACHLLSSLLVLGPAVVVVVALVQRAALLPGTLAISTTSILPLHTLSSTFLPVLGLLLATTLLLARPYINIRNCSLWKNHTYTINP